ncbi:MAG TPA: alpha/beta fold hydrolase [Gemmatimonadaceae bacterium]
MLAPLLAATVLVLGWGMRAAVMRATERRVDGRFTRGPEGIIAGAEPIALDGDDRGVLLLHGFGDTPQSLRDLAHHLHGRGYTVRVPLLPGHGRSLAEFGTSTGADWLEAARDALATLRARTPRVALVGQSMGGALAVLLAASEDIEALVLLAPYLTLMPHVDRLARWHRLIRPFAGWVNTRTEGSILDPAARARSLGYGVASPRLLAELRDTAGRAWEALPAVTAPTLFLQSRRDHRIRAADAQRAYARLTAEPRDLVWVDDCGHVLTVDFGREEVFARTTGWLERFMPRRS